MNESKIEVIDEETDPLMMRQYVMAHRAHVDYIANMKAEREEGFTEGLEEGREEGRKEGREEGRKTIVRTIREGGTMTDEQIAALLKLPLEFVGSV